jgi:AbrB family looped-hinge helix DNA binding protein
LAEFVATLMPLPFHDNVKAHGGMEMGFQRLSSKNQIVIPKEARQAMGVKGGDELLIVVKDHLTLVMPKPKRYARTLRGLAKGTYPPNYLKRERRSWQ